MFKLGGVAQHYAWGTADVIPRLLGQEPDGRPWAEYWFGAHPLGDSPIHGHDATLGELVEQDVELLGAAAAETFQGRLPYLVKFLSAGSPLSLQAHPTREQAREGYARESLMGIPIDAAHRSFRDEWPKPEAVIALTPFEGLLGFRDPKQTAQLFEALGMGDVLPTVIGSLRKREATAALQEVFLDVLSLGERRHVVDEVLAASVRLLDAPGELGTFAKTAVELDEHFPGDPSILAALLMNRFSLEPGEAISLEPGIMHAYLRGTCVEVLANSDNVLRGGLTQKHIDVDALLQVVKFEPGEVRVFNSRGADGLYLYPTTAEEFEIWLVQPVDASAIDIPRAEAGRILVSAKGNFQLQGSTDVALGQGEALFVPAGEQVHVSGHGKLFVVAPGV